MALAEGARRLYKGRMGSLTKDITDKLDKFNKQFRTDDIDYGKSNRPIGKSPVSESPISTKFSVVHHPPKSSYVSESGW